jgi:hypothetical protein
MIWKRVSNIYIHCRRDRTSNQTFKHTDIKTAFRKNYSTRKFTAIKPKDNEFQNCCNYKLNCIHCPPVACSKTRQSSQIQFNKQLHDIQHNKDTYSEEMT